MPFSPREKSDSITEARVQQLVKKFLNSELRAQGIDSDSLADDVAAAILAIDAAEADIDNLERRVLHDPVPTGQILGVDPYENIRRFAL